MKEAYPASPVASLLGRRGGEWGGGFCGWGATEGAPQDWNERKTAVPGWGGGQCGRKEGMPQSTGQGVMCQISLAYSAMVRSVLNLPELAMFIRHMRAQREGCS